MHEEHTHHFKQYGVIDATTGSVFLPQFKAPYIGMAHPYTLLIAVGDYDVKDEKRCRRPEPDPYAIAKYAQARREDCNDYHPEASLRDGGAGLVRLFDVARGMSETIAIDVQVYIIRLTM